MAARSTESLSVPGSSTSRASPPTTSDVVTPGSSRAQAGVPVFLDPHDQSARPATGQVVDPSGGHQAAVVDDDDGLAEVLDLIELVTGEEDAAAGRGLLGQHAGDGVDPRWVQPGQRLVEEEELGPVDQGRGQLDALLVAVGQRLDLDGDLVRHPQAVQPGACGLAGVDAAQTVQLAQILELLPDEHPGVQAALFGHVAEPAAVRLPDRMAAPPDLAGVEVGEAEDGPHGGGLAGPVRPEEADDLPGGHREGETVEGGHRSEVAPQPLELQEGAHPLSLTVQAPGPVGADIDRRLAPRRRLLVPKGRSHAKPGSLLKSQIPIRTWSEWDEGRPGFVEIDLVGTRVGTRGRSARRP